MGRVIDSEPISRPEHLEARHSVSEFDCGVPELNSWLRERALANEVAGASRTYVVCLRGHVVGYYSLAVGAVSRNMATGRVRRQMPEPVPVMLLGRLAVADRLQGRGLGSALLRDAVLRTLQVSEQAGIRAILLHAINHDARAFYLRAGFQPSPVDPMTLMVTIADVRRSLAPS